MTGTDTIDVDDIWRALGPWGKYQWKQLIWYIFSCCTWAINMLSIVFIGYRPPYECRPSPNKTLNNDTGKWYEYGQCSVKEYRNNSDGVVVSEKQCENGWTYDIPTEQSFVTEWSLLCGNEELAELSQALMTIGMAVGAFVFPSLSDRFGRKTVMVFSHLGLFVTTVGTSFCNSYTVFIILKTITGAVQQGGLAGTSLALEMFPTEARCYTEPLALVFWTTAICVMSPIAYFLRNYSWRYLQLTYSLLGIWTLFQWWMLDESLRWLIANEKLAQARQVIRNACKWNKKDYSTVVNAGGVLDESVTKEMKMTPYEAKGAMTTKLVSHHGKDVNNENMIPGVRPEFAGLLNENKEINGGITCDQNEEQVQRYTVIDTCRYPRILRVSLILWFTWLTDNLTYYGLFMISSDLYGDRYINFFLSALCEYPAVAFELYAFTRLGRPFACMLCHAIAALGLILATVFTTMAGGNTSMLAAATAFTLIGKMGISAAFSTNYLLTPELYPTNLRTMGIGVAAIVGKVGGIIAPFSRNLAARALWAPGAIFSVCCLGVVIGMMFVPETSGVELPQTIEELSAHYTNNKWKIRRKVSTASVRQKSESLFQNEELK